MAAWAQSLTVWAIATLRHKSWVCCFIQNKAAAFIIAYSALHRHSLLLHISLPEMEGHLPKWNRPKTVQPLKVLKNRRLSLCVQKGQYLTHQQEDSFVLCTSQEKAPGPSPQGLQRLRAEHAMFNKKTEMESVRSPTHWCLFPTLLRSPWLPMFCYVAFL